MRPKKSGKITKRKTLSKKTPHKAQRKVVTRRPPAATKIRAATFATPTPLLQSPRSSSVVMPPEGKIRHIFVWSLVLVAFFGMVSILASSDPTIKTSATVSVLEERPAAAGENVSLPAAPEHVDQVTITATGDVLLARYVELKMRRAKDYTLPFHRVADFLKSADITFANLETPLLPGPNTPSGSMTFRGDLEGVEGLLYAGYDVLSIANNHTMNYQEPGLFKTMATLRKAGIAHVGGGANQDEAHTPVIFAVGDKKVAFYAYNDSSIPPRRHGEATADSAGIAAMDVEVVKNDVKNARALADFVVVSMHAGREYQKQPTPFQRDFAHAAIDAGASIVIGTHPHVVQPVEKYNGGVIFYSLGNFVFDQFFSQDVQTGLTARITLEEGQEPSVELFPVKIDQTQPRITEGEEKSALLRSWGM